MHGDDRVNTLPVEHPRDLTLEHVDLADIAWALSRIHRWHGYSSWSVAKHSLAVASALPDELKSWGLLHDASEALAIGDVPTPVKTGGIRLMEERVLRLVSQRFKLVWPVPPEVKLVDRRALRTEMEAEFGVVLARRVAPRVRPLDVELPAGRCRAEWLAEARRIGLR